MKTEKIIGMLIIIILLIPFSLIIVGSLPEKKSINIRKSGDKEIVSLVLDVSYSIVNLNVSPGYKGWFVNATVNENSLHEINLDGDELLLGFSNAIITVIVGESISHLDISLASSNGVLLVVKNGSIGLNAKITDSNFDMILISNSTEIDLYSINSNIDSNVISKNITGDIEVINGNVDLLMLTTGIISYNVSGHCDVIAMGFNVSRKKLENGEVGKLISNGPSNIFVNVLNGNLDLIAIAED